MSQGEVIGAIGDILLWSGLLCGVPLLIVGLVLLATSPRMIEVTLTVVEDLDGHPQAFWTVGDHTYSGPMHGMPARGPHRDADGQILGFVSPRRPDRLRFERRAAAAGTCLRLAAALLAAALLGELLGYVPQAFGTE